jgi:hypothetical protein
VTGLVLRPVDVAGPLSWTWRLLDADGGTPLAGHRVRIDPAAWQFEAFADLGRYLQVNVDPARRLADEARIVGQLGAWAAGLLGEAVTRTIASRAPVTVTVEVPDGLGLLPAWPWELAHADGVPRSAGSSPANATAPSSPPASTPSTPRSSAPSSTVSPPRRPPGTPDRPPRRQAVARPDDRPHAEPGSIADLVVGAPTTFSWSEIGGPIRLP